VLAARGKPANEAKPGDEQRSRSRGHGDAGGEDDPRDFPHHLRRRGPSLDTLAEQAVTAREKEHRVIGVMPKMSTTINGRTCEGTAILAAWAISATTPSAPR
jgi:hypothetical protein